METNNIEFNTLVNTIIKETTGKSITEQIENGSIKGLPDNYELVIDFDKVVYGIRE